MKSTPIVLIAVGGVLLYTWVNRGISGATAEVIFDGFSIKNLNDFQITLRVQNVGNGDINVNALTGEVTVNDNFIGNVSDFNAVSVPARSERKVQVEFTPSFLSLPATILELIKTGVTSNIVVAVKGNLNYNGIVLPFSTSNQ